jgi:GT2 family glycosyltransferase
MTDCPPVSVVIINYNKKDVLRQCIASAIELDWPDLEFIVVDNASPDGSADMVEAEFGSAVRLVRRRANSPTAARNQGFLLARGEFILSLDNDILLPDKSVIRKGVALFSQFPNVGLLAFKVGSVDNPNEPLPEHWWYPAPLETGKNRFFYTDLFSEGAVLIRSEAIRASGGYDENFFQAWEDVDLALRLIRDDFNVLFCPSLACAEIEVRGFLHSRPTRINYLALRNRLWTIWKHYPLWRGLCFATPRVAAGAFRSVRYGWFGYFSKALKDGVFAPRAIREQRRPLGPELWTKIDEIHRGRFVDVEPMTLSAAGGATRNAPTNGSYP